MSSQSTKLVLNVIKQTGQKPTGSIIFLHGSGKLNETASLIILFNKLSINIRVLGT